MSWLMAGVLSLAACAPQAAAPAAPRPIVHEPDVDDAVNVLVYVSPGFSERERANVVNGIALWERATSGVARWELVGRRPEAGSPSVVDGVLTLYVVYRPIAATDPHVVRWDSDHELADPPATLLGQLVVGYVGNVASTPMEVVLVESRLLTPRDETLVTAHEFGHVLGLDHLTRPGSVLSERYGPSVAGITRSDVELFCRRYRCPPSLTGARP